MKQTIKIVLTMSLAAAFLAACATRAEKMPQVNGENLLIHPPSGWRLAHTNGDPDGNYVVEFMPNAEEKEAWREGYMSVQRGAFNPSSGQHMAPQALATLMQVAQTKCPGRFVPMTSKDTQISGAYAAVGGGFCSRDGDVAPYGEGNLTAIIEGRKNLFLVQFGWRPATEDDQKDSGWRIRPERLKQYLDLINQASLCGAQGELPCPP